MEQFKHSTPLVYKDVPLAEFEVRNGSCSNGVAERLDSELENLAIENGDAKCNGRVNSELSMSEISDKEEGNLTLDISQLDWCIMTMSSGDSIDLLDNLQQDSTKDLQIAEAISRSLAVVHRLKLTDDTSVQPQYSNLNVQGKGSQAQDQQTSIKRSQTDEIAELTNILLSDREGSITQVLMPFWKDEGYWEKCHGQPCWSITKPWQPFLNFLERRRSEIYREVFSSASLPKHLAEQLNTYLPKVVCLLYNLQSSSAMTFPVLPHHTLLFSQTGYEAQPRLECGPIQWHGSLCCKHILVMNISQQYHCHCSRLQQLVSKRMGLADIYLFNSESFLRNIAVHQKGFVHEKGLNCSLL